MSNFTRIFSIISLLVGVQAQGAILFKGNQDSTPKNRFDYDRTSEAQEVSSFWSKRKIGVGVAAAGAYGLMGGTVSIHFHPEWSVDLGFGGGSHFQSFGFRIKQTWMKSSALTPYWGVGFQRWQRSTDRPFDGGAVSPGYVASQFMEDDDRRNSIINEQLVHGSLGLQYVFVNGDWAGYGVFIEAVYLLSVEDFDSAPTASLGFNYFF